MFSQSLSHIFPFCLRFILPNGNEHLIAQCFRIHHRCMRHHSKFKASNLKRASLMIDQLRLFIYPAVHPRCNRYLQGGAKRQTSVRISSLMKDVLFSLNCRLLAIFRSRTMRTNFWRHVYSHSNMRKCSWCGNFERMGWSSVAKNAIFEEPLRMLKTFQLIFP